MAWTPIERYSATIIITLFIILGWYQWLYKPLDNQMRSMQNVELATPGIDHKTNTIHYDVSGPTIISLVKLNNAVLNEFAHVETINKKKYNKQLYRLTNQGNFTDIITALHHMANSQNSFSIVSCLLERSGNSNVRCINEVSLYTKGA